MANVKPTGQFFVMDFFLSEDVLKIVNTYSKIRHNINEHGFNGNGVGETRVQGDPFFDSLLLNKQQTIEKIISKHLNCMSSVFTTYINGSVESLHIKNAKYQMTCLINVGDDGTSWPLIVDDHEIELKPGSAVLFCGNVIKSGRKDSFKGDHMFIVELHYCENTPYTIEFANDGRKDLGTPPLQNDEN